LSLSRIHAQGVVEVGWRAGLGSHQIRVGRVQAGVRAEPGSPTVAEQRQERTQ